jgi:hypothetical protein
MGLPNIEAPFMKAYPPERTEVFLDGHESAFAFFGVLSESPEPCLSPSIRRNLMGL